MIVYKNILLSDGSRKDLDIQSAISKEFSGDGLLALPAVIDPHVHFRTPGMEYKEDWRTGAKAAIRGGCNMVFDMPNTIPPTITRELFHEKIELINSQLASVKLPLKYKLFFGADKHHLDQIALVKDEIIGIKVFMGCSTGNLVIDDDESLAKVFEIAAQHNLIVAVHAEDEHLMRLKKSSFISELNYAAHSTLRDIECATSAVAKAIHLSEKFNTTLYILHVSSKEEIVLIREAKTRGVRVYAETTPHHLFFNDSAYEILQGKAQVNPPLRDASHQAHLLQAIRDGVIDTIGSDHAPHTIAEKQLPYGQCPSGMPGIEFMLPMLLNAYHQGLLSLMEIEKLTSSNARKIFKLPANYDWVIIDLQKRVTVSETLSRCGWTPYEGMTLTGWPMSVVINGVNYFC